MKGCGGGVGSVRGEGGESHAHGYHLELRRLDKNPGVYVLCNAKPVQRVWERDGDEAACSNRSASCAVLESVRGARAGGRVRREEHANPPRPGCI